MAVPHAPIAALALALAAAQAFAQGFSFSTPDDEERAEREAKEGRIAAQLSTP